MTTHNNKHYCKTCNKYFSSNSSLKKHYLTQTHSRKDLLLKKQSIEQVTNSHQTNVDICYTINGEEKNVISYRLGQYDNDETMQELNKALKPVAEIIKLSNEMNNPNSNKESIQKRLEILSQQLTQNLLETGIIQNVLIDHAMNSQNNFI